MYVSSRSCITRMRREMGSASYIVGTGTMYFISTLNATTSRCKSHISPSFPPLEGCPEALLQVHVYICLSPNMCSSFVNCLVKMCSLPRVCTLLYSRHAICILTTAHSMLLCIHSPSPQSLPNCPQSQPLGKHNAEDKQWPTYCLH